MSNGRIASFGTPAEVLGDIEDIDHAEWYSKDSGKMFECNIETAEEQEEDTQSTNSILEEVCFIIILIK